MVSWAAARLTIDARTTIVDFMVALAYLTTLLAFCGRKKDEENKRIG
jgi:hypothetical protein